MNLSLSLDGETLARVRRRAETLGKSVDQLVLELLEQLGGKTDCVEDAVEFRRLSLEAISQSRGWKFNRDEIHAR